MSSDSSSCPVLANRIHRRLRRASVFSQTISRSPRAVQRSPRPSALETRLGVVLIGSHVSPQDPLAAAQAEGADVVQIFLGNPQSWKAPKPREDDGLLKNAGA